MPTPTKPPCFPDLGNWPDGTTEIRVPSEKLLKAYWDAAIYDPNGVAPANIISVSDDFVVCFRVELRGDLWRCMCGEWCFELGFAPCGKGTGFNLSDYLTGVDPLHFKNWKGCDTQCIELCATVPAGTIPADVCTTMYDVCATFELRCCDKPAGVLVGYEALGPYQFYQS